MEPDDNGGRRKFLTGLMALPALSGVAEEARGQQTAPPSAIRPALFNAIQMGPHTMLDEGIDRCLDLIQETAGVNPGTMLGDGFETNTTTQFGLRSVFPLLSQGCIQPRPNATLTTVVPTLCDERLLSSAARW